VKINKVTASQDDESELEDFALMEFWRKPRDLQLSFPLTTLVEESSTERSLVKRPAI
jgi:hypothetical protein